MTLALQVNPGLLQCNKHAETIGLGGDAKTDSGIPLKPRLALFFMDRSD
jgi:hypothetical protein